MPGAPGTIDVQSLQQQTAAGAFGLSTDTTIHLTGDQAEAAGLLGRRPPAMELPAPIVDDGGFAPIAAALAPSSTTPPASIAAISPAWILVALVVILLLFF